MENGKVCNSSQISGEPGKSRAKRKAPSPPSIESRYNNEWNRLRKLTKQAIPADSRGIVMPLLPNIAFLKVKLDEARRDLLHEGIFTAYDNGGGQTGMREHPGFAAYNKLFTTFSRSVKQLIDMMPAGSAEADALMDYIQETRYD